MWALNWEQVLARGERALCDFGVYGVRTTIPYYMQILRAPEFRNGRFDTGFVEDHPELTQYKIARSRVDLAAALAAALAAYHRL